tara:strand:- start:97 stop:492 length:396 start_codon:yes stop_codon:yes gene_type:complete
MTKVYLTKIIANDNEGLQMISACCAGAKVKISDIKYLQSNKVFLISVERAKVEIEQENKKINSICKFDFVDSVKSKNINQKNQELILELIGIDFLKNKNHYEINLMFSDNAYISLRTETIEARLEDQNEIE